MSSATAQDTPVITVRKSAQQLDLSVMPLGGPEGTSATKTLNDDLALAGAFQITQSGSASYTVRGTAANGTLQGQLTDRAGAALLNKSYTGNTRSAAHEFADDIVLALTKTRGIASGKVAFIGTRTGHKEVYTCDSDGANLKQLTADANISVGPALSPDGRRLAYTGYKSGYADIYVIDLASGARDRVIKFPGTNTGAAFSADGSRLAMSCSRDGNPELYVSNVSGGNAQRLTHTPTVESSPTWSPDGGEIIYVSDAGGSPQLYRISAGGGNGQHLAMGFGYCTEPNWSPDGRKVVFNVRGGGGFDAAVLDLGSGSAKVGRSRQPRKTRFGARIHDISSTVTETALYVYDVPTGKKVRIISGVGKVSEPAWTR